MSYWMCFLGSGWKATGQLWEVNELEIQLYKCGF